MGDPLAEPEMVPYDHYWCVQGRMVGRWSGGVPEPSGGGRCHDDGVGAGNSTAPSLATRVESISQAGLMTPRRSPRFMVDLRVEGVLTRDRCFTGHAANLSTSGMLLESPIELELDGVVRFSILLGEAHVDGRGTTIRKVGAGRY